MANQLRHIQAHLKSERKRLTEELKLEVIPSAAERHEGSPFGKRVKLIILKRVMPCSQSARGV